MTKKRLAYFFVFITSVISILVLANNSRYKRLTSEDNNQTNKQLTNVSSSLEKAIDQYDIQIDSILKKHKTVGAAIAIVYKDSILYTKCHGVKNCKTNDSIDKHTVFRLASVSKAVTGVLSGILVNENKIDLQSKVKTYLPTFKLKDSINTYNLTIENLLDHTTGLVPHAYDNLVESGVEYNRILNNLEKVRISAPPGKLYGYQNVTFSLVDTIFKSATKTPFDKLINEYVFEPFCMQDASVGLEAFEQNPNIAYPHHKNIFRYKKLKLNKGYYNTIPAAGVNASITDMANLIVNLLKDDQFTNQLTNTIFKPRIITPLGRRYLRSWGEINSKYYGLGWRILNYRGHQVAYHGGYIKGYKTELAIFKDLDFGIVYLSNSPDKSAALSIPTFLNLYLPSLQGS